MTLKLSVGLAATLGLPFLLASVFAQQAPSYDVRPRASRSTQSAAPAASTGAANFTDFTTQDPQATESVYAVKPATTPALVQTVTSRRGDLFFTTPIWTPEEANFARESDQLAKKLGEAKSDSDRGKIKEELGQVLEKQFDLRQKRHLDEIKSLEDKIKKLKELVEKRQENRREIVANRLDQIMRDSMGLGW